MSRPHSPAVRAQALSLLDSELTPGQAGRKLGVPPSTVRKWRAERTAAAEAGNQVAIAGQEPEPAPHPPPPARREPQDGWDLGTRTCPRGHRFASGGDCPVCASATAELFAWMRGLGPGRR